MGLDFESKVFETRKITLGNTEERIVAGGRDLFRLLPKAVEGINKIGVTGLKTFSITSFSIINNRLIQQSMDPPISPKTHILCSSMLLF